MLLNKDALYELLLKLKKADAVFVVEGKKDAEALKFLKKDFFLLAGKNKSLFESAELIAKKCKFAVLLLDADSAGKKLAREFVKCLQMNGVRTNTKFGLQLLKLTGCRQMESTRKILKGVMENEYRKFDRQKNRNVRA